MLSEMAGAMHEMAEALLINPNNVQQINDSLNEAIDMPLSEQKRRNKAMQERLQNNDIKQWAQKFMQDLQEKEKEEQAKPWDHQIQDSLINRYKKESKRQIIHSFNHVLTS